MQRGNSDRSTYPMMDLLRGLAAVMVMCFHVTALGEWHLFSQPAWEIWGLPVRSGWVGVDLFLVISGFVITLSALRDHERQARGFHWRFLQRRLYRLLPLYGLTCAIYLFLVRPEVLVRPPIELGAIMVSHALFIQNMFAQTHGAINGVTWSLALEMQFYIALIIFLPWLKHLGPWRALSVLVGIAIAWRYGLTYVLVPGLAETRLQVIYSAQLPGTLDAFGMGIVLALFIHASKGSLPVLLRNDWRACSAWLVFAALLLAIAGQLFIKNGNYWQLTEMIVGWRALLAAGFGALVAAAITCPLQRPGVLRPFAYLGEVSYGLYLWHFPLLLSLISQSNLRGGRLMVVVFFGSLVLASLSWHLMEKLWIRKSGLGSTKHEN